MAGVCVMFVACIMWLLSIVCLLAVRLACLVVVCIAVCALLSVVRIGMSSNRWRPRPPDGQKQHPQNNMTNWVSPANLSDCLSGPSPILPNSCHAYVAAVAWQCGCITDSHVATEWVAYSASCDWRAHTTAPRRLLSDDAAQSARRLWRMHRCAVCT